MPTIHKFVTSNNVIAFEIKILSLSLPLSNLWQLMTRTRDATCLGRGLPQSYAAVAVTGGERGRGIGQTDTAVHFDKEHETSFLI